MLGKVNHHFIKKEYQALGAPHYHVFLWIDDALVFGSNSDDEVLDWTKNNFMYT